VWHARSCLTLIIFLFIIIIIIIIIKFGITGCYKYGTKTTLLILKPIWYCNHSTMVLRPLKYGVTTILILNFSKYQYGI